MSISSAGPPFCSIHLMGRRSAGPALQKFKSSAERVNYNFDSCNRSGFPKPRLNFPEERTFSLQGSIVRPNQESTPSRAPIAQSQVQSVMLLQRLTSPFFVVCWLLTGACTVGAFWQYELTAGVVHPIPAFWPSAAKTGVSNSEQSLLMFVHPRCGCTRAGLQELRDLLSAVPEGKYPSVTFFLLQPGVLHSKRLAWISIPPGPSESHAGDSGSRDSQAVGGWNDTPTEAICRAIPGSRVLLDAGGVEARRFGVTTSGTCLLYSTSGKLLFSGGLTQSRGHVGPNRGRDLLTQCLLNGDDSGSLLLHHDAHPRHHATFGCALFSEQDQGPL
jgi:hypothetical protein